MATAADGVTFRPGCDVVREDSQGDVAYPSVIRSGDGLWHMVYSADDKRTIRHLQFDAA